MTDETYDALILGCGPAGMPAAVRAANLGLRIGVVDEQGAPGGQVWRGIEHTTAEGRAKGLGKDYADGLALVAEFRDSGVDYLPQTAVWEIEQGYPVFVTRQSKDEPPHRQRR